MMTTLDEVGKTAFIAAQLRADEAQRERPLFVDGVAKAFVTEESRVLADEIVKRMPPASTMLRLRTRYLDDILATRGLQAGIPQIVILGSGFDSRPIRFQSEGLRYYEIDTPPLLQLKKAMLERNGYTARSSMIGGDYLEIDLTSELAARGFDSNAPALVFWEGNTMYLPREKVLGMLQILGGLSRQIVLVFDYVAESVVVRTSGNEPWTSGVDRLREIGAPLLTGFDDIHSIADAFGYIVHENHSMRALCERYIPELEGGASLAHCSIATLSKTVFPVSRI